MVLGITSTLLYCYAFPQLIIEVAYLLYLKTQSKEYWEQNRTERSVLEIYLKNLV